MQIENDHDKEVYNGDIGYVVNVDPDEGELTATFDGRPVVYGYGELDTLVPAYAVTIHKLGISCGGHSNGDAALRHAAAQSALYGDYSREKAGRFRWPEEGRRHCRAQCLRASSLVQTA